MLKSTLLAKLKMYKGGIMNTHNNIGPFLATKMDFFSLQSVSMTKLAELYQKLSETPKPPSETFRYCERKTNCEPPSFYGLLKFSRPTDGQRRL